MEKLIRRSILSGTARAPPSAPAAHRALVSAMLSQGQSVISNLPASPDIDATISACIAFGADIVVEGGVADVFGAEVLYAPRTVDCGASNTTLKLFMPIASLLDSQVAFSGKGRLLEAPLAPYGAYLERLGVYTESDSGTLPIKLHGPISETELVFRAELGTQFYSGLLFALPLLEDDSEIELMGSFASPEYAEMALGFLRRCQIEYEAPDLATILISGGQAYAPFGSYEVPPSAYHASFLALAGALCGKVALEGNADYSGISSVLSAFGASVKASGFGLSVSTSLLEGCELQAGGLGSLLPHALVLGCLAEGETRITGIASVKRRMNSRMRLLMRELSKMGAKFSETPEGLSISGGKLSGAEIEPEGDAAVAMACAVAALASQGQTRLLGSECVEKSYPGFFKDLASLGAIIR